MHMHAYTCMRIIALPARPAGPRWWRLAHARGGAAPRGRPDDRWIHDASRVARVIPNYLSAGLGPRVARTCGEHTVSGKASASNLGGGDDGKVAAPT
eukprot:scaffold61394_cov35-Phaeocystis_antarctica.AAC.2